MSATAGLMHALSQLKDPCTRACHEGGFWTTSLPHSKIAVSSCGNHMIQMYAAPTCLANRAQWRATHRLGQQVTHSEIGSHTVQNLKQQRSRVVDKGHAAPCACASCSHPSLFLSNFRPSPSTQIDLVVLDAHVWALPWWSKTQTTPQASPGLVQ